MPSKSPSDVAFPSKKYSTDNRALPHDQRMAKLKITQTRGVVRQSESQRRTLQALGLWGIQQSVVHEDTPQIRGMIRKVEHLVEVDEANG